MTERTFGVCMVLLLALGACGCQCCCLFDPYADAVDYVATHEHCLDPLYRPWYDLTRIGRPDWCQCGLNRALCPCACERRKPAPHFVPTPTSQYIVFPPDEPGRGETSDAPPADNGIQPELDPLSIDPAPALLPPLD